MGVMWWKEGVREMIRAAEFWTSWSLWRDFWGRPKREEFKYVIREVWWRWRERGLGEVWWRWRDEGLGDVRWRWPDEGLCWVWWRWPDEGLGDVRCRWLFE